MYRFGGVLLDQNRLPELEKSFSSGQSVECCGDVEWSGREKQKRGMDGKEGQQEKRWAGGSWVLGAGCWPVLVRPPRQQSQT